MQPGPWLWLARSYSPHKTRQTCQRDEATGQPRQTKQQTNSGTNQPPDAKGGRKSLWRMCMGCWGRRSSAILSYLSKLAPSTAHQTNINMGRADQKHQGHQTRTKPSTTTRGQTKGATNNTPKHTQAAKQAEKAKERTGTKGKTAGGGQQQQDKEGAREGSKDRREEAAQAKEKGACSSSGVLRGVLDHPRVIECFYGPHPSSSP